MHIRRRDFLKTSASTLLTAGCWPGAIRAADKDVGAFHFIAVNDFHSLDKKCLPWFERAFKQMKAHKEPIDFLLACGDLANDGKKEQLGQIRDALKDLGIPFHAVCGNHDFQTQTDRKPYEELFPEKINYHFEHKGWHFAGLDTSDGIKYQKTNVQPHTLKYLDDTLPKLDKKKPLVVFTHFPLGETVNMRPLNAEDVLQRFKEHNLRAVYSGHFHGFTERKAGDTVLTTGKCCAFARGNHDGTKDKGYFLCKATKQGLIERTFVEVKPA